MRCPNCRKPVELSRSNPFRPFCSQRCRQIDLGLWAGEQYRVAGGRIGEREHPDDGKKKKLLN
ncbi:MAG: DNA gyrase inhibitor YacG [Candidatus Binataceae bacterium]